MAEPFDFASAKRNAEQQPATEQPAVGRRMQIKVNYVTPDAGLRHESVVVSEILDADKRMQRARLAAEYAGGVWEALPPLQRGRLWAMATLEFAFPDPPTWLPGAWRVDDVLLFDLFRAVEAHDARFFRRHEDEGGARAEGVSVQLLAGDGSASDPRT